jgi:hypothetical protein
MFTIQVSTRIREIKRLNAALTDIVERLEEGEYSQPFDVHQDVNEVRQTAALLQTEASRLQILISAHLRAEGLVG